MIQVIKEGPQQGVTVRKIQNTMLVRWVPRSVHGVPLMTSHMGHIPSDSYSKDFEVIPTLQVDNMFLNRIIIELVNNSMRYVFFWWVKAPCNLKPLMHLSQSLRCPSMLVFADQPDSDHDIDTSLVELFTSSMIILFKNMLSTWSIGITSVFTRSLMGCAPYGKSSMGPCALIWVPIKPTSCFGFFRQSPLGPQGGWLAKGLVLKPRED